jgi:GT2 family glycosyltransferase
MDDTTSPPDVTVVIPIGVADGYLPAQLRALAAQADAPLFEVVLAVNTPVPADRAAIDAARAASIGAPVRIVDASARRGASFARNAGAAAAAGAILAFCDADDLVHPGWLGALVAGLDDFDAVSGRLVEFAEPGPLPKWRPPATPGDLPAFLGVPYLLSGNLAIRRELFEEIGGFDEDLTRCEDIAISWRLLQAGRRIGYAPDAVIDYRVRSSLSGMLHQHYLYGIGMSEVLLRIGRPGTERTGAGSLLRPNNQAGGLGSPAALLRKAALGSGRLVGIARERFCGRRAKR